MKPADKHPQVTEKSPDNIMKSAAIRHSTKHEKGKKLANASPTPVNVNHG